MEPQPRLGSEVQDSVGPVHGAEAGRSRRPAVTADGTTAGLVGFVDERGLRLLVSRRFKWCGAEADTSCGCRVESRAGTHRERHLVRREPESMRSVWFSAVAAGTISPGVHRDSWSDVV